MGKQGLRYVEFVVLQTTSRRMVEGRNPQQLETSLSGLPYVKRVLRCFTVQSYRDIKRLERNEVLLLAVETAKFTVNIALGAAHHFLHEVLHELP